MSKERNYGIDLLRIVSMYLVVVLHLLGSADIEAFLPLCSLEYEIIWLIEMLAFYAVNCYALISGYVYDHSKRQYTSLILLWAQVFFYSVLITMIFFVCYPNLVSSKMLVASFFPAMTNQYWYFTAYVLLYMLMPALALCMEKIPREKMKKTLLAGFILFSVMPTIFGQDIFGTNDGYSALWLGYLFLVGAYIKKYDAFAGLSTGKSITIFVICIGGALGAKFVIEYVSWNYLEVLTYNTSFTKYTSPNVVIEAVALLILFSRKKITGVWRKIVVALAPLSFGVYLVHTHTLVLEKFMFGKLAWFSQLPLVGMVVGILIVAGGIFGICLLVDYVRLRIFKVMKVKLFAETINKKIMKN